MSEIIEGCVGAPAADPTQGSSAFTTDGVSAEHRHAHYQRTVLRALVAYEPAPDFYARIVSLRFGDLALYLSETAGQTHARRPERIALDGHDHYIVRFCIGGAVQGDFDGRSVMAGPGQVLACDLSRPMIASNGDIKSLDLFVPRQQVESVAPGVDLHGLVLDGDRAGLLVEHLVAVVRRFPHVG